VVEVVGVVQKEEEEEEQEEKEAFSEALLLARVF
jgi:hypothetical protein